MSATVNASGNASESVSGSDFESAFTYSEHEVGYGNPSDITSDITSDVTPDISSNIISDISSARTRKSVPEFSGHPFETLLQLPSAELGATVRKVIDLVTVLSEKVVDRLPAGVPAYNRRHHFGGWINADWPEDCYDTRSEVLIRDARVGAKIEFRHPRKCDVVKSEWLDPYTGEIYKLGSAVQVDHVVPLKNAYEAGGYSWSPARRCHYANYMENSYHLRTVSGHENMSKGSKRPDMYMPPNESYQCTYLSEWMKIKVIWDLTVTTSEINAIKEMLESFDCPTSVAKFDVKELEIQRRTSQEPVEKCLQYN